MSLRRLRTLAVSLAGLVIAGGLSVVAAPAAQALDTPGNPSPGGAQLGIPTFTWDRVPGATTYDFQISTSDLFTSPLVSVTTVQRQYVPRIQLPTGTQLYWRVRAQHGVASNWATTSFSRAPWAHPTLDRPGSDAGAPPSPDSPVTLSLAVASGALTLLRRCSNGTDPNFVDQATTTNRSRRYVATCVPVLQENRRVRLAGPRPCSANGLFTAWSAAPTH